MGFPLLGTKAQTVVPCCIFPSLVVSTVCSSLSFLLPFNMPVPRSGSVIFVNFVLSVVKNSFKIVR